MTKNGLFIIATLFMFSCKNNKASETSQTAPNDSSNAVQASNKVLGKMNCTSIVPSENAFEVDTKSEKNATLAKLEELEGQRIRLTFLENVTLRKKGTSIVRNYFRNDSFTSGVSCHKNACNAVFQQSAFPLKIEMVLSFDSPISLHHTDLGLYFLECEGDLKGQNFR